MGYRNQLIFKDFKLWHELSFLSRLFYTLEFEINEKINHSVVSAHSIYE